MRGTLRGVTGNPQWWAIPPVSPEEAVAELLGSAATGDEEADLWAAGERTRDLRTRNSMLGGVVFKELNRLGRSYREQSERLGMPATTIYNWANPPKAE